MAAALRGVCQKKLTVALRADRQSRDLPYFLWPAVTTLHLNTITIHKRKALHVGCVRSQRRNHNPTAVALTPRPTTRDQAPLSCSHRRSSVYGPSSTGKYPVTLESVV